MDVTTGFLNGKIKEEVFMDQPKGFIIQGKKNLVCKLKHYLYGLKQAPSCCNFILDEKLKEMGFAQATSDPCIYIAKSGEPFIIGIYVDDILLAGKSDKQLGEVKLALAERFDMKIFNYFSRCQDSIESQSWYYLDWSTDLYRRSPTEVWYGEL